jgi:hypothetical protein
MSDERLEVNHTLRYEGNGKGVIARLVKMFKKETKPEGETYTVAERTLVVELFRDEETNVNCNVWVPHTNLIRISKIHAGQKIQLPGQQFHLPWQHT